MSKESPLTTELVAIFMAKTNIGRSTHPSGLCAAVLFILLVLFLPDYHYDNKGNNDKN